tara:strand:- start:6713 stop:7717 length:1005 start_codon:yes stop_codon:yes gene_type:complete
MIQEPPFCIQFELTEGCNLACSFCGIQGIRENKANGPDGITGNNSRPYKFMTVENAESFSISLKNAHTEGRKWNPRIEMAMHGEPTMNPDYIDIVRVLRNNLPNTHLMITSNGGGLLGSAGVTENINQLMKAGLNVLLLDNYDSVNIVPKVKQYYTGPYPIYDYPLVKSANPHRRRKPTDHDIVVVDDISNATSGNHASLNNHCGSAFPINDDAAGRRCGKPFREMSIRWDGNVAGCCNDWRGSYRVGNIFESDLNALWQSAAFNAMRAKLYHGDRDFGPCAGCDALTYRPGLLPDHKGQQEWPKATAADEKAIGVALQRPPYTTPVKRPWERP